MSATDCEDIRQIIENTLLILVRLRVYSTQQDKPATFLSSSTQKIEYFVQAHNFKDVWLQSTAVKMSIIPDTDTDAY